MVQLKTKVLIMAQGEGSRWQPDVRFVNVDIPAVVKQFIRVGEETILTRTLRQIQKYKAEVYVVINQEFANYLPFGTMMLPLDEPTGKLLRGIWIATEWTDPADRTVVLLGDVVYSNNAIKIIFEEERGIPLFGRKGSNPVTGKEASELFALAFSEERSK